MRHRLWCGLSGYLGAAALLALLLIPFVFLTDYAGRFGYPARVPPFGTLIVALVVVAAFFLALAFKDAGAKGRAFYPVYGLLAAAFTGLLAIYAGAFASNLLWGDAINYRVVTSIVHSSVIGDHLGSLFKASPGRLFAGLAAVVVVYGGILVLVWAAAAFIVEQARALRMRASARRGYLSGLLGGLICVQAAVVGALAYNKESFYGEPVVSFFELVRVSNLSRLDNRKMIETLKDAEIRASYAKLRPQRPKNVVVIFSDSLRADHMSVYGYSRDTTPFLRKLYQQGALHRVDMALSSCSESFCGIASTLSSRPFDEISVTNFKITDLLRDVGYKINFFLSGDHRAWGYLREYYGGAIDTYTDYETLGTDSLDDRPIVNALAKVGRYDGRPNLFYFFLMSSHQAGKKYPEYERFPAVSKNDLAIIYAQFFGAQRSRDGGAPAAITPEVRQSLVNRYDNGVVQADAYIEKIFGLLRDKGYLEDSLIVVMADHADALGEHGHFDHGRSLYQEDIRIALLLQDSDGGVFRNSRFASMMDVAPTIVDRIGLPVPSSWKGRSLTLPPSPRVTFHQTRRGKDLCFALVESDPPRIVKYMKCLNSGAPADEYLFDLAADPDEKVNLVNRDARTASYRKTIDERFDVVIGDCEGAQCTASIPHVLSYGTTPSRDGYARLGGATNSGVFAIATTNVGTAAKLTARIRLLDASVPVTAFLCETNPADGACKAPPSPTVTRMIDQGEQATWSTFLMANGPIPLDPDRARVIFEFVDGDGVVRGSTSTAVTTVH